MPEAGAPKRLVAGFALPIRASISIPLPERGVSFLPLRTLTRHHRQTNYPPVSPSPLPPPPPHHPSAPWPVQRDYPPREREQEQGSSKPAVRTDYQLKESYWSPQAARTSHHRPSEREREPKREWWKKVPPAVRTIRSRSRSSLSSSSWLV